MASSYLNFFIQSFLYPAARIKFLNKAKAMLRIHLTAYFIIAFGNFSKSHRLTTNLDTYLTSLHSQLLLKQLYSPFSEYSFQVYVCVMHICIHVTVSYSRTWLSHFQNILFIHKSKPKRDASSLLKIL